MTEFEKIPVLLSTPWFNTFGERFNIVKLYFYSFNLATYLSIFKRDNSREEGYFVAQWVEHFSDKETVVGSSPTDVPRRGHVITLF